MKKFSISLILHIGFLLVLLLIVGIIFYLVGDFSREEVSNYLIENNFSLFLLFILSLIEGFLFFGIYFIGGVAMFLYVGVATSIFQIIKIILIIWFALIIDCFLNYFVGLLYSKRKKSLHKSLKHFQFDEKKLKEFNKHLIWFCFHTTSIAFLCFYYGYKRKSILNLIPIIGIVLLVLVFYATIIYILFNTGGL